MKITVNHRDTDFPQALFSEKNKKRNLFLCDLLHFTAFTFFWIKPHDADLLGPKMKEKKTLKNLFALQFRAVMLQQIPHKNR